jgi:hypothetical protein
MPARLFDTPEDDRRFTIADVSERMKGSQTYFDALLEQMKGPESCPHHRGLVCFVELVTKRWKFDRDILKKTVWTEADASHVRENLSPLQRFIVSGYLRGKYEDPKGQIPYVIHLEGDEAKVVRLIENGVYQKTLGVVPFGQFEDLFRTAYPDKFVRRDYGTPDAIRAAFVDLVGAEPKLRQLRVDGKPTLCLVVPPYEDCMAMLDARNLLPKRDGAAVEDAGAGEEKDDPLFGWKALPAFSKHPGAMTDAAQAFGRFLREPSDLWAHAALVENVSALADYCTPAQNVVPMRRVKR